MTQCKMHPKRWHSMVWTRRQCAKYFHVHAIYGYIFYQYLCNTSHFSFFEFELRELVMLVRPVPLKNRKKRRKRRSLMKCTVQPHVLSAFMTSQSWSKWQRSRPCLPDVQTSSFFLSKQNHDLTEHCCKCITLLQSCQGWITATIVCGTCQRSS